MSNKRRKVTSGFCLSGWHEGTKPQGIKTCPFFDSCPCKCHKDIDKMFEQIGEDRILIENPRYSPKRTRDYWMPGDPEPDDDRIEAPPLSVESTEPDVEPALVRNDAPAMVRTATGRRAKGSLEEEVRYVCEQFSNEVFDWDICSPKRVAEEIGKLNATEPPSTGAIQAVWNRWEALGFAKQDKKPARFVGFTDGSSQADLDAMKRADRMAKKRTKSRMKRGELR